VKLKRWIEQLDKLPFHSRDY